VRACRVWVKALGLAEGLVEGLREEAGTGAVVVTVQEGWRGRDRCGLCRRRCREFERGKSHGAAGLWTWGARCLGWRRRTRARGRSAHPSRQLIAPRAARVAPLRREPRHCRAAPRAQAREWFRRSRRLRPGTGGFARRGWRTATRSRSRSPSSASVSHSPAGPGRSSAWSRSRSGEWCISSSGDPGQRDRHDGAWKDLRRPVDAGRGGPRRSGGQRLRADRP
jgi:hypothetical protein